MAERISELEESSTESTESEEKKEWRKMNLKDQWTILSSPMYVYLEPQKRESSRKNIEWQKNKKEGIIG